MHTYQPEDLNHLGKFLPNFYLGKPWKTNGTDYEKAWVRVMMS